MFNLSIFSHTFALLCVVVASISFTPNAQAQDSVDLKLESIYDPPQPWPPGTFVRSTLRVSNLSASLTVEPIIFFTRSPDNLLPTTDLFHFISGSTNCSNASFCEQFGNICFFLPAIEPGQSFDCTGATFRAIERRSRGSVQSRFVGIFEYPDPDLSNNTVTDILRVAPFVTQVPVSTSSYLLAALLLLGVGMVAVRRA